MSGILAHKCVRESGCNKAFSTPGGLKSHKYNCKLYQKYINAKHTLTLQLEEAAEREKEEKEEEERRERKKMRKEERRRKRKRQRRDDSVDDGGPIPAEGFGVGGVGVSDGYQTPIASSDFDSELPMDVDDRQSEDFFENDEVLFIIAVKIYC